MQVLSKWWAGPAVYLLTVLGSIFVTVQLLPVVLLHTIMLARPHLEGSPSPLSLMQRRKIDAALSLPPSLARATPLVPAEVPTVPLADYVARLDTAEVEDQPATPSVAAFELESQPSSIATERMKLRVARAEPRSSGVTAGDIFNRSFGVLTAASN